MAKSFCPHCEVMLTKKDLGKGSCEACGKKLPRCPSCDVILTKPDLEEGRCDACGKKLPRCPFCDVTLTRKDQREGWCDACGKKLPLFLTTPSPAPRPAQFSAPAARPPNSKVYRFAWWMDRICLGLLLFVFASCAGVPVLFILFEDSSWSIDSRAKLENAILMVQISLIFALVAGMLVAKGIKVLCGTDGS